MSRCLARPSARRYRSPGWLSGGLLLIALAGCEQAAPPAPTAEPPPPPVDKAAVLKRCDDLAADPDDPKRYGSGVTPEAMQVGYAIEACEAAVALEPQNPRMQYQLGRALYTGARWVDAYQAFRAAANQAYPLGMKSVGDAFASGKGLEPGDQPDDQVALQWYQKSTASGDCPICERALLEQTEYLRLSTFDAKLFQNPEYMRRIYEGDFDDIEDQFSFFAYASGLFKELDSEQIVDHAPECKPLLDYLGSLTTEYGGWSALFRELLDATQGPSGLTVTGVVNMYVNHKFNKDQGMRDTYNLVNNYGCKGEVGKRTLRNLGQLLPLIMQHVAAPLEPRGGGPVTDVAPPPPVIPPNPPSPAPSGQRHWVDSPDELNVRAGPGAEFGRIAKLRCGEPVTVVRMQNGWADIGRGWVNAKYLSTEEPQAGAGVMRVNADELNVRSAPAANAKKVAKLRRGDQVTVVRAENGWAYIGNGWVNQKYLTQ